MVCQQSRAASAVRAAVQVEVPLVAYASGTATRFHLRSGYSAAFGSSLANVICKGGDGGVVEPVAGGERV